MSIVSVTTPNKLLSLIAATASNFRKVFDNLTEDFYPNKLATTPRRLTLVKHLIIFEQPT